MGSRRRRWTHPRRLWRWLFALVLLAGLAFVVAHRSEGLRFAEVLQQAEPGWILVGLALQFPTYCTDGLLWQPAIARLGFRLPLADLIRIAFAKFFVDQVVPMAGITGTILVMRSLETRGVSRAATVRAMVARFITYYIAYAIALAAALLIAWWFGQAPRIVLALGSVLAVVLAFAPVGLLWMLRRPGRELPRWLRRLRPVRVAARALTEATPEIARDPGLVAVGTALQLLIFVLDGATLWASLAATGVPVTFLDSFAGFMLGFVVASLGFVPSGVGIFEAGAVAGLGMMGVPVAAALTGTLIFRGLSLWLPLLPGAYFARKESWR